MMDPKLILLRDTNIDSGYDMHITLDVKATLFIPKNPHRCMDTIYDGMYTMETVDTCDFLKLPMFASNPSGIVMPYELIDETDEEYMFQSYVLDPLQPMIDI